MMVNLALLKIYGELPPLQQKDFIHNIQKYLQQENDPMLADIAHRTGETGLIAGGFYAAVVTGFICPPALIGIAAAGALWWYGKSKR